MKAGVIGLGHGSRVLINAFRLSNIEVYGIASKNKWKAEKIKKEKKIEIAYRNWKLLIKDKKINIVAIAVPAVFQIGMLKECIKENKIILCEKPLGINISEINKAVEVALKCNKPAVIDVTVDPEAIYSFRRDSFKHRKK